MRGCFPTLSPREAHRDHDIASWRARGDRCHGDDLRPDVQPQRRVDRAGSRGKRFQRRHDRRQCGHARRRRAHHGTFPAPIGDPSRHAPDPGRIAADGGRADRPVSRDAFGLAVVSVARRAGGGFRSPVCPVRNLAQRTQHRPDARARWPPMWPVSRSASHSGR